VEDYAGFEPQIGEIRALRTFRIGPGGILYPLFSDTPWADGSNTARCNMPPTTDEPVGARSHAAPEPDCTCGYYAYAAETGAAEHPHARYVLAVVACWGKVIAGTRGIRAQHARIEALWMGDTVPSGLANTVATRYPATTIYSDKAAMLGEHPPTPLDCYEIDIPRDHPRSKLGLRVAIVLALAVGSLPGRWIWQHQNVRLIWAGEVCFFIAAVVILRLTRTDMRARAAMLLYAGVTMWLIAPFAGTAGVLLLRLPLLQIATFGLIQRNHINREAKRFPARITRPEP
jgi:hypothetical protein